MTSARQRRNTITADTWKTVPLGMVAQIVSGFGFPKELQGKPTGDLPFFKVADISAAWKSGQQLLLNAEHYISEHEAKSIKAKPFPKGTVVFAKIGEAIKLNRRAILGQPSIVDNNVMGLVSNDDVDCHYLYYWTLTQKLGDISQATTVPSVRKSDVQRLEFPLAPLDEQRRIVAEIEKQFSRLDEAVANLKRVKANLKRYKAAVLKAAVEGRLVETEAELARREGRPYETGEQLLQRILETRRSQWKGKRKYKEPTAPDTTDLPELPEGWVWTTVIQLADIQLGKMLDRQKHNSGHKLHYLRNINVRWGSVDLSDLLTMSFNDTEVDRFGLKAGDVLVCEGGEPGRAAIWDGRIPGMMYQKAIHRVRFHIGFDPKLLVIFLEHLATRGQLERWITGSTIKHLTKESFIQLPIPLPPQYEQERITAEADRRLSQLGSVKIQVDDNLRRAEGLRRAILETHFTIDVNR